MRATLALNRLIVGFYNYLDNNRLLVGFYNYFGEVFAYSSAKSYLVVIQS